MSPKLAKRPPAPRSPNTAAAEKHAIRPEQSVELLKELHILTRDGQLNQDSRRKLKQVYHLFGFIEPLLNAVRGDGRPVTLVDHGAGKSYLGFILYDLWFKSHADATAASPGAGTIHGIESRAELVERSSALAARLGFSHMAFHAQTVADALDSTAIPPTVDIVTALHACDTATDDAMAFALARQARFIVLVPCCQAEVAALLRQNKQQMLKHPLAELWRHPIHTREFGSHLTNVLRCLHLEAQGYQVTVTELVGWEHSMKNELIIAERKDGPERPRRAAAERLRTLLESCGLQALGPRFGCGAFTDASTS